MMTRWTWPAIEPTDTLETSATAAGVSASSEVPTTAASSLWRLPPSHRHDLDQATEALDLLAPVAVPATRIALPPGAFARFAPFSSAHIWRKLVTLSGGTEGGKAI
jgi:hypothetical protein